MPGVVCGSMARTVMNFASRGSWCKCKCTCAVCHSHVGVNYVECSQWKSWVHKRRSSISNWLVSYPIYTCPGCNGKGCPIDSTPVTEVALDCAMLDVEDIFATYVTCCDPLGAVTVLLTADFAWPGESSGNSWLSSSPGISLLRVAARCVWPVPARLCSTVTRRGDRILLTCSSSTGMTAPWSAWCMTQKAVMIHYRLNLTLSETLYRGYYSSPSQPAAKMGWTC